MIQCRKCFKSEPDVRFVKNRKVCNSCRFVSHKKSQKYLEELQRKYQKESESRKDKTQTSKWIVIDSVKSDRKFGRNNDLTLDFVHRIIESGCFYCGASQTQIRMTLDRIDNNIGHLQCNVNPSCIRCNYARGNMPYQAWLCLIPGIKQAHEQKLFGDWLGGKLVKALSSKG